MYTNEWNLSDEAIERLGLVDRKSAIGSSYANCVRMFDISGVPKLYLVEGDTIGEPIQLENGYEVTVFNIIEDGTEQMLFSIEMMEGISRDDLLKILNERWPFVPIQNKT